MASLREIDRRRTFAIIAHPDAGKTTLTEKFLLYGGAVQLAGSVTARKHQRATTSDWMELERKRGISVNSTVMQFDYGSYVINLLDTPGHNDFSEDTYRVLMAVDAVIMIIDAGKGIESQTRKLFEVCRLKGLPIFTFMNKCDRPMREPLELLDEIEQSLQLGTYAMNWPAGTGPGFSGVYERRTQAVHFFDRAGGSRRAPVSIHGLSDPLVRDVLDEDVYHRFVDELGILDQAGTRYDAQAVLDGNLSPVYFGSAINNFGVQLLLDGFLEQAPPPGPRHSSSGIITPDHPVFSGFIFKIQSNMNPRHRDRIAFLRVCSGRFHRDMHVIHSRTGKSVRLASSHKVFARERETVHEAWPGDVVGIVGHSEFGIGDTLSGDPGIVYHEIPRFAPECFAFLRGAVPSQHKRFRAGMEDLLREGLTQTFLLRDSEQRVPLLGAVGPLQFEVLQYRLKAEYGAESRLDPAPWRIIRWVTPESRSALAGARMVSGVQPVSDERNEGAVLFEDEWCLKSFIKDNPKIGLSAMPVGMIAAARSQGHP